MTNSIIKVTIINAKRIMLFSSELFGVFMAVQMAALSDQQTLDIHLSTIFIDQPRCIALIQRIISMLGGCIYAGI